MKLIGIEFKKIPPMGDAAREAEIARGALLSEPIPAREEEPSAALAGSAHECHICGRRGHSSLRALEKHFKACQQVLRRQRRDKLDARMQLRYARRVHTIVGQYQVREREVSLFAVAARLGITDMNELTNAGQNKLRFPNLTMSSKLLQETKLDVPSTARHFRQPRLPEPDEKKFGLYSKVDTSGLDIPLGSPVLGHFDGSWCRGIVLQVPCISTGFRYYLQYDVDDTLDLLPPHEIRILKDVSDTHVAKTGHAQTPCSLALGVPPTSSMLSCDRSGVSASISSTSSSDESSSSASCTPIRSRHRYIQPGPWPRKRKSTDPSENKVYRLKTRKKTRVRSRLAPEKTSDNELLPPWRDEAEQDRSRRLGMVLQHYCADVSSAGESFGELIMHTALSRYANTDNAFSDAHGDLDFLYCSEGFMLSCRMLLFCFLLGGFCLL